MTGAFIGLTTADSRAVHEPERRAPAGAPDVLVIVLDDLGFAQLGCFGGDIATPAIDRLAAGGLRYRRFHVTALCSPTRAALLTGRNHHAVGMGLLPELATHFPGYSGRIPASAAPLPRLLRDAGYSTFAAGKWHLTPRGELSAAGPFRHWPLGMGFERHYGFLPGDTNQYAPQLVRDNHIVVPPASPDHGYHLTEDLADQAMRMILDVHHGLPGKPFFCYFAPGAMHAPHHVRPQWSDPYRGGFDGGWDSWREAVFARQQATGIVPADATLSERPEWVRPWSALEPRERRLYARMMEVFAGFLTHTDAQIGRIVDLLDQLGRLDNTLVLLLSDNGASAEGGPTGSFDEHRFPFGLEDDLDELAGQIDLLGTDRAYNHYPWGWAWAGNTPFRLWKRYTWLGGTRTPLIVHWPSGFSSRGEVRDPFVHVVDLMPTVLDATGITAPDTVDGVTQQRVDGASIRDSFDDPVAPGRRVQYFEMLGSRSIYLDGWKATTDHVGSQVAGEVRLVPGSHDFATDRWALFDLATDFSETHDVADTHPERTRELEARWWLEAGANGVLPIDDGFVSRFASLRPMPSPPGAEGVYRPGGSPIPTDSLPSMVGGFVLTAEVDPLEPGAAGILAAQGNWTNGWAVYVADGRLVYSVTIGGREHRVRSDTPIPPAATALVVSFDPTATDGDVQLLADGAPIGGGRLGASLPFVWQIGGHGMTIGHDWGLPVDDTYRPPFPFTGTIRTVTIEAARPGTLRPPSLDEVLHQD